MASSNGNRAIRIDPAHAWIAPVACLEKIQNRVQKGQVRQNPKANEENLSFRKNALTLSRVVHWFSESCIERSEPAQDIFEADLSRVCRHGYEIAIHPNFYWP